MSMKEISTELHIIYIAGDGSKFIEKKDAEKHQEKLLRDDSIYMKKLKKIIGEVWEEL